MVLQGKELEFAEATRLAQQKLKGPGTLLNGLQILGYLQGMESATTQKDFNASRQSLSEITIGDDPFE